MNARFLWAVFYLYKGMLKQLPVISWQLSVEQLAVYSVLE